VARYAQPLEKGAIREKRGDWNHSPAQVNDSARKIGTSKFARWANPFLKVLERTPPVPTARRAPDGTLVYCVGDIHGRDDLLRDMAERVEADIQTRSFDHAVTIFLGDYIDRGPGSKRVLERLASGEWPTSIIALAGNHEDFLKDFLDDAGILDFWRSQGGLATLHSYEVDVGPAMAGRDFEEVQAEFTACFPKHHRDFLEALKISAAIGDYFFCHAGVRPGVALNRQHRDDLLNIREPFLNSEAEHGKLIVHGHTPALAPEIRPNRIGIDTGAYATGCLTCLVLEKDQQRFLPGFGYDLQRDVDSHGGNFSITPGYQID
jgi:serine/threonine protein phosphatase 1